MKIYDATDFGFLLSDTAQVDAQLCYKKLERVLLFLNPLLYHFCWIAIIVGVRWGINKNHPTFVHLSRAEHYVGFHGPYLEGIRCMKGLFCSDVYKLEVTEDS